LKADLTRFGVIDGTTLTCQLHGWQFNLASGKCLTSAGHELRSRPYDRATDTEPTSGPGTVVTAEPAVAAAAAAGPDLDGQPVS
jgi:hypothetical protein